MPGTSQIILGPVPHFKNNWSAQATYKKGAIVFHDGDSYVALVANPSAEPSYTYNPTTGEYTVSTGWGLLAVGAGADVVAGKASISDLLAGNVIPALAANLESWAERDSLSVQDTFSDRVRTTAGSTSILSGENAKLVTIAAKSNEFAASAFKATGFNLLHGATAVGTGFYFLVPALPFGTFGTAAHPNGILFTNSDGENLTPTVRFKALSAGVPSAIDDGNVCEYTDSNGYRFYNTPAAGYLIVSGITLASTCAHVAWSRRYDEFISPTEATDAGSSVSLSSLIHAVHSFDKLLKVGNAADAIAFGASAATWYRRCDRVTPTWANSLNEDGTYTHTATIASLKPGGAVRCGVLTLTVEGNTISYTDSQSTATNDYVYIELAIEVTGTVSISPTFTVKDWGLEYLDGATGEVYLTTQYAQSYPDSVAVLISGVLDEKLRIIAEASAQLDARLKALEESKDKLVNVTAQSVDAPEFTSLLYPRVLFGAGVPAATTVPANLPAGLPWDGIPAFKGQLYINTEAASGGLYYAKGTGAVSDWINA